MTFESTERLLREHSFTEGMSDAHVRFMFGCMKNVRYRTGEYLFREGEAADQLFLLRQGRVTLEVHAAGSGATQLESLGEGDVLGWSVLFPPHRWDTDCRVLETCVALLFDGSCLRQKVEQDLPFAYALTRRLLYVVHRRLERARLHEADVYGARA